jgi:hypothetical protein
MQVLSDSIHEELEANIVGITKTLTLASWPDAINDTIFVFSSEEICNFT